MVGHQVHGRTQDPGDVLVEDDRAVHLGQLAQAGCGERDVEGEPAGEDALDLLVVAEHDQRAGATAKDALEAVAQRGARRDHGERGPQPRRVVRALGTVGGSHGRESSAA